MGTPITSANIPDWHVADTIDLNEYLSSNTHRTVVRVFAREVRIRGSISCRAALGRPPLDLRIDCQVLRFVSNMPNPVLDVFLIDLRGTDGTLGWKSYAPAGTAASAGEDGFDGGNLVLNTTVLVTNGANALLDTAGGLGGKGQDGYPGWPGAQGRNGVDCLVQGGGGGGGFFGLKHGGSRPSRVLRFGTPPGNGGAGTAGGDGGAGGSPGLSGACVIRMTAAAGTFTYSPRLFVGGGAGGKGGKGGIGGVAGKPSLIVPPGGGPNDKTERSASPGAAGNDGHDGPQGPVIRAPIQDIRTVSTQEVFAAMQTDAVPSSLRIRAHMLIDAVLAAWAAPGSAETRTTVLQKIDWLHDLAQPGVCDFPDVVARYNEIKVFPTETPDFSPHIMKMSSTSFAAGMAQLASVGTAKFAADRPSLAARAEHHAAADAVRQGSMTALGIPSQAPFHATLSKAMTPLAVPAAAGGAAGSIALTSVVGSKAITDTAASQVIETATVEEVCVGELAMGPEGIIAVAATLIAFAIFTEIFGSSLDAAANAQQVLYESALAQHAADLQVWSNAESAREKMDEPNKRQSDIEQIRAGERVKAKIRDEDYRKPIQLFGRQFIGILVDIKDLSDDSGDYAVLDGFLLPAIPNIAELAPFIAVSYKYITFLLTIKVPAGAGALTLGQWYSTDIVFGGAGDAGTLEPAVSYLRTAGTSTSALLARGFILLPGISVLSNTIGAIDPLLATALNNILQLNEVANTNFTPKGLNPPKQLNLRVTAPATLATVYDVRQGSFHIIGWAGATPTPAVVVDMGGSSSSNLSATVGAALVALVSAAVPVPIVISHWDRDHWCILGGIWAQGIQSRNNVLGPSVCLTGQTLINLLTALGSHQPGQLTLVGSRVANIIYVNPNVTRSIDLAHLPGYFTAQLPANFHMALTNRQDANPNTADRNNVEALVVRAGGFLMPGDASYFYIENGMKQNVTVLEATHHGSVKSILRSGGGADGSAADNDIPAATVAGPLLKYSTSHRYNHGMALVGAIYTQRGWVNQQETYQTGDITFPL